ncbi:MULTISPECIES: helix-turn-helix domain-containing protein [Paenibacillus]|uniref:helix-turn-helix domain-containing protein n=1 Tax=Paenibacillus TaxID=44249 RepID=UPI00300AA7AA
MIDLLKLAQNGDKHAEAELVERYQPLINKFSRQNGVFHEDCKQQLVIVFILALRRFDLNRYLL